MSSKHLELGRMGENYAADYLSQLGYKIIERNIRLPEGEIDIIAIHDKSLIIIEVKTRRDNRFGEGYQAVNAKKQKKLRLLALSYLQTHIEYRLPIRFDVVSLLVAPSGELRELKHFPRAF